MYNPPDITKALKQCKSTNELEQKIGSHYLICKFQPLITKIRSKEFKNIRISSYIQDIIQAGNMGILIAINTYNNKSAFNSWVYYQIRNQLQILRENMFPVKVSRFMKKQGAEAKYITIDDYNENLIDYNLPSNNLIKQENMDIITNTIRVINKKYTKIECDIFVQYYFMGIPLCKLSEIYNTNANAIIRKMILTIRDLNK